MTLKLSLMRWCATLVGVQLLCGIVWVLGPLLGPLEPWPIRLVLMLALVLTWAVTNFLLDWRATSREQALANGIADPAAEEAAAVGAKLSTAMARLRKQKGRRRYLYEQPWYAFIGPPGAGKTTALLNAGLEFPLAGELGAGAVAGVGGTRLCDWWFTADATLIDTAGRYTTQDSDSTVDRAGWEAFLALLRRTRPHQPLNGVIVAIAVDEVVADHARRTGAPAGKIAPQDHARAIRTRIDELETRLGVRIPVYAMFTKVDLLIGFSEFFADLDRTAREQIWGATLALKDSRKKASVDVDEALRPLLDRLNRRVFQRLDTETNADRRSLIAGFPAQFASILPAVQSFVTEAFGPDAKGKAPLLRGLYLTSATQEGTPVDRLIGSLSRSFGLDQRRAAPLRPEAGRAYFLKSLLQDVVFREAMLVGHRPGAAERRKILRIGGFAACGVAALAGIGVLWSGRAASEAGIDHAQQTLAAQQQMTVGMPFDPVADADFARLVPWLDSLRAGLVPPTPPRDRLGFSQTAKLQAAGQGGYRHALEYALFPRLIWRAETQMRGSLGQPDALYEATRIYLMLGGAGPLDKPLILNWFGRDWDTTLPLHEQAPVRTSLRQHLAALLDGPLPAIALDGPLVSQARAIMGQVPLAQRAYSRLKPLVAANLPPWRPDEALGPAGVQLFLRLSGRPLSDGVPGLYTITGLRDGVLPALPRAAGEAVSESWVMGQEIKPDAAVMRTLQADIIALYAVEYEAAWDTMLSDLDLVPLRSLTQAAQDLFILASPHSPIKTLLTSATAQLAPGAAVQMSPVAGQVSPVAGQVSPAATGQVTPAATTPLTPGAAAPSGPITTALGVVDKRYAPLRALFVNTGYGSIDSVLRPLSDLQQELAKQAASAVKPPPPSPAEDPALALRAEAIRQPQPLARWLTAMATSGAALRDGGPRGVMIAAWNASGGPGALCQALLADHYPFFPAAAADISLEDFTRLLGPGGAIDAFFNAQLKPYVDTSGRQWKPQAVDGVSPPVTPGDLAQFQRAEAIRDMFFPNRAASPVIRFDVTPGAIDSGAASATLELTGIKVVVMPNALPRPVALSWPARQADAPARLTVTPASAGGTLQLEATGPWAPFRLISRARVSGSGDRVTLTFSGNDRTARFDVRASPNPFVSTLLPEFRCPAVQ